MSVGGKERRRESGATGFTLIDLLITLVILSILAMTAIPSLRSTSEQTRLNGAATELVVALQYASGLAVRNQRPFGVAADTARNYFQVFDLRHRTDPTPHHDADPPVDAYGTVLNPSDRSWYNMDFDTTPEYRGVDLTSVPPGGEVRFYPDGHSAESDSVFGLALAGRYNRTVTVQAMTGRITAE